MKVSEHVASAPASPDCSESEPTSFGPKDGFPPNFPRPCCHSTRRDIPALRADQGTALAGGAVCGAGARPAVAISSLILLSWFTLLTLAS
jgi:hypothetical protein